MDKQPVATDFNVNDTQFLQEMLLEDKAPLRTLYEWKAPERVFAPKGRAWYVIVATAAMLSIVLAALTNNIVLIFLIIALVLVVYALYTVPPRITTHRITNKGLNSFDNLYFWKNIIYFWVTQRGDEYQFNVEFKEKAADLYYHKMILLKGDGNLKTIANYFIQHVDYLNTGAGSFITTFVEGKFIPLLQILNFDDVAAAEKVKDGAELAEKGNASKKQAKPV
jgi:hypothetical protein